MVVIFCYNTMTLNFVSAHSKNPKKETTMKKYLIFFGAIILGSVVTFAIDQLVGISFKDVNAFAQITHKVTYMLWGGAIAGLANWARG